MVEQLTARVIMPPKVGAPDVPVSRDSRFGVPRVELRNEGGEVIGELIGMQEVTIKAGDNGAESFVEVTIQLIADISI